MSDDDADVGVVSLSDRRRIRALEAQVNDLQSKLAHALTRATPGISRDFTSECFHRTTFVVSEPNQEVRCADCNALMDPYLVLRRIANREVNFCYTLNQLRDESKNLRAEVNKLKATRSRLRRTLRGGDDVKPEGIIALMRAHSLRGLQIVRVSNLWTVTVVQSDGKHESSQLADPEAALTAVVEVVRARGQEAAGK